MKRGFRLIAIIGMLIPWFFSINSPVHAIPPMPSSMYGTVKLNNANVPDGTLVEGFINNLVFAQSYTQTYNGNSVYTLDIPGDDAATAVIDGGKEGEEISFRIGGVMANEKGVWHSATNVELNLTATAETPIDTPIPKRTAVPTQTAIVVYPTYTKTPTVIPSKTMTVTINPSTAPSTQITPQINTVENLSQTDAPKNATVPATPIKNRSDYSPVFFILVLLVLFLLVIAFFVFRKKNST
jgi:hypothetical protein